MNVTCKDCNAQVAVLDIKFIAFQQCPECKFWGDFVKLKTKLESVRINGKQFWIGSEDADHHEKGFGGKSFLIKKDLNPKPIRTTNLHFCGDIPLRFLSKLQNNACFITEKKR